MSLLLTLNIFLHLTLVFLLLILNMELPAGLIQLISVNSPNAKIKDKEQVRNTNIAILLRFI